MANRRVSVWKYVKIDNRWKYCKPVYGQNNKIKPHWALVEGKPEYHPEGNFYISRRDGKRKIWKKVGLNPSDAVYAAKVEESMLNAKAMGIPIKTEVPQLDYDAQMWKFLADYKLSQSAESHALMSQTLEEFRVFVKKANLKDITRADMLRYKQWLVNRDRSLRTAGNKMLRVNQFLRAALGVEAGKGLVTVKDAKFVEREPEVYTDDVRRFRQLLSVRTGSKQSDEPAIKPGEGIALVICNRSGFATGATGLQWPGWDDGDTLEEKLATHIDSELVEVASRLVLFSIQMLLLVHVGSRAAVVSYRWPGSAEDRDDMKVQHCFRYLHVKSSGNEPR